MNEMIELAPEDFESVLPLVKASGMRGHLAFIYAVLEKRHPGRVFVDDLSLPQMVLFCNLTGFYFAFGVPNQDLVRLKIAEWLAGPMSQELTALFSCSPAWNALLSDLLPHAPSGARLAFEQKAPGAALSDWRARIPDGFSVQPITADLARSIVDGTGTGGYGIDPWFIRIAGGPQAYAEQGLGMAVVEDAGGQIASICGFCALGNQEAEMEVGASPAYRGRGLAALVSAAFIEQCLQAGWHPAYSCNRDNLPSIGVAHKLGFMEVEEIQGYSLSSPLLRNEKE